ncbi:hypothetical protein FS749_008551 [Ceratobasidium sp. UAMH 11750]|nr:hypothetical protein FS749_008551 [Ceratobasidium sp. UAMH 11750]
MLFASTDVGEGHAQLGVFCVALGDFGTESEEVVVFQVVGGRRVGLFALQKRLDNDKWPGGSCGKRADESLELYVRLRGGRPVFWKFLVVSRFAHGKRERALEDASDGHGGKE